MNAIAQMSSFNDGGRHILKPQDWKRIRLSLRLSLRETQITQYIFDDEKTECIATELGISVHTVNTYLQRLYFKLDVRSRSQLILRVMKNHLEYLGGSRKANIVKLQPVEAQVDVLSIADTGIQDLQTE